MQTSAEKIWSAAQAQLRSMLSADTYNLWFAPLRACQNDNHGLTLEVANDFCEVWLKDNYLDLLQEVVAVAAGRQLPLKFKVGSGSAPMASAPPTPTHKAKTSEPVPERVPAGSDFGFNPKNTFDTFVV